MSLQSKNKALNSESQGLSLDRRKEIAATLTSTKRAHASRSATQLAGRHESRLNPKHDPSIQPPAALGRERHPRVAPLGAPPGARPRARREANSKSARRWPGPRSGGTSLCGAPRGPAPDPPAEAGDRWGRGLGIWAREGKRKAGGREGRDHLAVRCV